jgi:PQQ-like domain
MDGIVHVVSADGIAHGSALVDGEELWSADLSARSSATPLIVDDILVIPDESGRLHGLSPGDGSERWTLALDGGPIVGAAVTGMTCSSPPPRTVWPSASIRPAGDGSGEPRLAAIVLGQGNGGAVVGRYSPEDAPRR